MEETLVWLADNKLFLLLAIGSFFGYYWLQRHKERLSINNCVAMILSILNTVFGVLFVKLFAFIEGAPGAMSLFGGVFFMPLLYYMGAKVTKRSVAVVCDIFAVCTIFTVMCARTNCLLAGCCGGTLIPGMHGMRWPTQLTEIIFYIVLIAVLWNKVGKPDMLGLIYPMYLMLYGAVRFALEFFREKDTQYLIHLSHVWAILSFAMGSALYYEIRENRKRKGKRRMKI